MTITVVPVRSPRDLRRFLDLPQRIYRDDPHYVPPVRAVLRRRLRKGGSRADSDLQLLLAERDGEVVGTISVLRDRRHEKHRGEAVAFFGFFECVDDAEVARMLLDAATARAREFGATSLRGPRNFSRVEQVGILIEGHDSPPPMLAAHHPRYYQRLVETCGFAKRHDVLAYDIALRFADGSPRPLPQSMQAKADAIDIPGLQIRSARRFALLGDLRLAHEVFTEAFADVPENTPMPRRQFVALGRMLLAFTNRRMLQVATVDERAAGFALCFPEMNEALATARGRVLPLGWWRVLRGVRRVRTASFKLIGVMPDLRGRGLVTAMIARTITGVQDAGYDRVEASLIDERNAPSRGVVEGAGMEVYKRYRIYERPVA